MSERRWRRAAIGWQKACETAQARVRELEAERDERTARRRELDAKRRGRED